MQTVRLTKLLLLSSLQGSLLCQGFFFSQWSPLTLVIPVQPPSSMTSQELTNLSVCCYKFQGCHFLRGQGNPLAQWNIPKCYISPSLTIRDFIIIFQNWMVFRAWHLNLEFPFLSRVQISRFQKLCNPQQRDVFKGNCLYISFYFLIDLRFLPLLKLQLHASVLSGLDLGTGSLSGHSFHVHIKERLLTLRHVKS